MVRPTTPTFLSDPEAPPPTNPVVYSPVPTMSTSNGASEAMFAVRAIDPVGCGVGFGSPDSIWIEVEKG